VFSHSAFFPSGLERITWCRYGGPILKSPLGSFSFSATAALLNETGLQGGLTHSPSSDSQGLFLPPPLPEWNFRQGAEDGHFPLISISPLFLARPKSLFCNGEIFFCIFQKESKIFAQRPPPPGKWKTRPLFPETPKLSLPFSSPWARCRE